MAAVLKARVINTENWHGDTVHVRGEMVEPSELGFKGGQYIIVNSGQLLPNGKLGKRAFSIPSSDLDQRQFDLVVKKIPQGIGSGFMHDLKVDDVFEFSGPWGKYQIPDGRESERILNIATDTGITAALGLMRGKAAAPFLSGSKLIWFESSGDYFIPADLVRTWVPSNLSFQIVSTAPAVDDPSRSFFIEQEIFKILQEEKVQQSSHSEARESGRRILTRDPSPTSSAQDDKKMFTKIYLSGDGLVLRHLKSKFVASGNCHPEQIIMESFFHHESLKTASV